MSNDPAQALRELKKEKEFLVGIDSDGCVFDTMAAKQRGVFMPTMIDYFKLEPVAEAARECKEFADLFSKTRGINRHQAVVRILCELLPGHPLVKERSFSVPAVEHYQAWVHDADSTLSNAGLAAAAMAATGDEKTELENALAWSEEVNRQIEEKVKVMPPFAGVKECLEKANEKADLIVVSQTPCEALEREWEASGLKGMIKLIAGQELGTKTQHLAAAMEGKFKSSEVLMIGDAPGDMKAARANGAAFCPAVPGAEEASWRRLHEEGLEKFFAGKFPGEYEDNLVAEFDAKLPEHPPWL